MSINVTVTGNPVSIKRGKMVTAYSDHNKNEFDRRRLMRLEQVRQQSKEIAAGVRNKVRKERKKQISSLEKEQEEKLKEWQARKLVELQTQYQERLKDFGLGHVEAELVNDVQQQLEAQLSTNRILAEERGSKATRRLQAEKNAKEFGEMLPARQRKLSREVENTRSAMVAQMGKQKANPFKKKKERKKCSVLTDSSSVSSGTEDVASEIPKQVSVLSEGSSSSESAENSSSQLEEVVKVQSLSHISEESGGDTTGIDSPHTDKIDNVAVVRQTEARRRSPECPSSPLRTAAETSTTRRPLQYPVETRISDRIKHRSIRRDIPDICDTLKQKAEFLDSRPVIASEPSTIRPSYTDLRRQQSLKVPSKESLQPQIVAVEQELPEKPTIIVRSTKDDRRQTDTGKVASYDHQKKSRENIASKTNAEKQDELRKRSAITVRSSKTTAGDKQQTHNHRTVAKETTARRKNIEKQQETSVRPTITVRAQATTTADIQQPSTSKLHSYDSGANFPKDYGPSTSNVHREELGASKAHTYDTQTKFSKSYAPGKSKVDRQESGTCPEHSCDCCAKFSRDYFPRAINNDKQESGICKINSCDCCAKFAASSNIGRIQQPGTCKVHCYDYRTKFSKDYMPSKTNVEKITDQNIKIASEEESDSEMRKLMEKRDRDAELRGRRAMEKVRTRKDYQKLLEKLPELQKQERLSKIFSDKPEHHMSEDRLRELEDKRQFHMENAYEKLFPNLKPAVITIPPKNLPKVNTSSEPFKVIDLTKNVAIVNVGSWDVAMKDSGEENIEKEPSDLTSHEKQLREIRNRLKAQKELLLAEVTSLPKDSNLDGLIEKLTELEEAEKGREDKEKKIRVKYKKDKRKAVQVSSTSEETSTPTAKRTRKKCRFQVHSSGSSTSPSPRKKAKIKIKKQILVLQNISTQTTPVRTSDDQVGEESHKKPEEQSKQPAASVPPVEQPKKAPPPDCTEANLCEIIIKISDNNPEPEITVKPMKKEVKEVVHLPVETQKDVPKIVPEKPKPVKHKEVRLKKPAQKTWRDHLSQNANNFTSSSTSYYSPPEVKKPSADLPKGRPRELLLVNPQQSNLTSEKSFSTKLKGPLHPFIVKTVEKLLTMSRISVEELSVSGVSDVSTPGASVIETSSNDPLNHLRSIMKSFNLTVTDIQELWDHKHKRDEVHNNTLATLKSSSSYTSAASETSHSATDASKSSMKGDMTKSSTIQEVGDEYPDENFPKIMSEYAEIAENCAKRISSLTKEIEKVRLEKQKMMQSPDTSDKENQTTYADLPLPREEEEEEEMNVGNDTSFLEQEVLNRKLLDIDFNLAEHLKKISKETEEHHSMEDTTAFNKDDHDIMARFKRLLAVETEKTKTTVAEDVPFVPLFQDIPKLPKLSVPELPQFDANYRNNKRPPPAKGLTAARRFNENIIVVPHELSTIVEVDSQMSTRLIAQRPETPDERDIKESGEEKRKSSSSSLPDILSEVTHTAEAVQPLTLRDQSKGNGIREEEQVSSNSSSNKSSELRSLEKMLKEIGMGWAIATLRKTQEALALTSSSSSLDINIKQKDIQLTDSSGSTSEISLRGVMSRHMMAKVTSGSSDGNESSFSMLMKEFQDISAIQGSGSTNKEGQRRQTSTPIDADKSKGSKSSSSRASGSDK